MKIITGMHRSGTSFVSQCLDYLGADFGNADELFPADKWNQKGYFENCSIIDINNRAILGDAAKMEYWLQQPENRIARIRNSFESRKWKYFLPPKIGAINKRAINYNDRILNIFEKYEGRYVKDPRFCLTIGSWLNLGAIDAVVFCFRNPGAVARSIRRRESIPMVFGYRLWLYHVESFLSQVPNDLEVLFVNFDEFFNENTQEIAFSRLAKFMGLPCDASDIVGLKDTLDIRLRTQDEECYSKMPKGVKRTYSYLLSIYESSNTTIQINKI